MAKEAEVREVEKDAKKNLSRSCNVIWSVIVALFLMLGIVTGFVVGKYFCGLNVNGNSTLSMSKHDKILLYQKMMTSMKAENIKESLRYLSDLPHPPGSERNKELANKILSTWKTQGMDKTESFKYNVLLSYPKAPGEIRLWNGGTLEKKIVINTEPPFDESEKKGKVLYPFNAFSGAGSATGELVYANYGEKNDFEKLEKAGINLTNKIIIMRYGGPIRTLKVLRAEERGAIGVIIYTDPDDHTIEGHEYPKGWMLNRYGVQRGNVNRLPGDALSIGYPAKDDYFRKNESKYSGNPMIPSQPVSYSTAYEILKFMKDDSIALPKNFQGALNFTYALQSGKGRTVTVNVYTELLTKESYTVCGTLYGSEEKDRYVLIGNHRDAWTYGAADASSGTADMMEVMRALANHTKKTGWRPRRSIMACSWGAEESGVHGSTEWSDENHKFLTNKVALYINIDMAVEGNYTLRIKSLNIISDTIGNITKLIDAPDNSSKTLYEDWLEKSAQQKNKTVSEMDSPIVHVPAGGSDYKPIWKYGVTITDLRYIYSPIDYPKLPQHPQYHTRYESFGWMTKFVDPMFKYHLAVGKLWLGQSLYFADADIIPFNLVKYMKQVKYFLEQFERRYKSMLKSKKISLETVWNRLNSLIEKTKEFTARVNRMNSNEYSPYELRAINDKLMNFEKNFVLKGSSPYEPLSRHVIYSTTLYLLYNNEKFPGIGEAIYFASKDPTDDWDEVRRQITLVVWCLDTANRSLDLNE